MADPEFNIEFVDPATLIPNSHNFRRHPATQRTALEASIEDHGWLAAPIVNRQTGNTIIDGHARVELAAERGEVSIPVRMIDVTLEEERVILRRFDAITALAETDTEALDRLIAEIGNPDLEAMLQGIESGRVGLLVDADPDAIPEEVETRCQPGDLWRLGEHRLLCGDSTVATDVERLMGGERAECVFTDPPYPLTLGGRSGHGVIDGPANGTRSRAQMFEMPVFEEWVPLLRSALTPDCDLFVMSNDRNLLPLLAELERAEAKLHNVLVMQKNTAYPHRWFSKNVEFILFHYYGEARPVANPGRGCVFEVQMPTAEKEHPTQKPVAMVVELLENLTSTSVYDPFLGSGTTLIAAEQTGRRGFGLEVSPAWCDVILSRWENATGRTAELVD